MRIRKIAIFTLIAIHFSVYSQRDFRSGYVISNQGDTITGKIDYRGDILMGSFCTFKNKDRGLVKYQPGEISGYFVDNKCYRSIKLDDAYKFLEALIEGKLSVYYLRDRTKDRFFVKKENGALLELEYYEKEEYINQWIDDESDSTGIIIDKYRIKKSQDQDQSEGHPNHSSVDRKVVGLYKFKTIEHQEQLKEYLNDVPQLFDEIEGIKKPDQLTLVNLAEEYNKIWGGKDDYIIYDKKKYKTNINVEFLYSKNTSYNIFDISPDNDYELLGISVNIGLSKINERIYLRLGLEYSEPELRYKKYTVVRVPAAVKYQYPGRILKPFASAGFNIYWIKNDYDSYTHNDICPTINAGMAIPVYRFVNLEVSYNVDFHSFGGVENEDRAMYSGGLLFGLLLDF